MLTYYPGDEPSPATAALRLLIFRATYEPGPGDPPAFLAESAPAHAMRQLRKAITEDECDCDDLRIYAAAARALAAVCDELGHDLDGERHDRELPA